LDLFCKAGGASMGLHRAGFDVVGVDIEPQPNYPFPFVQADALNPPFDLSLFDLIWASPVCKKFTSLAARHKDREYPDQIAAIRDLLWKSGVFATVIENVPSAPLIAPVILCGSMFGLKVRRHRAFETRIPVLAYQCDHLAQGQPIDVTGTGGSRIGRRLDGKGGNPRKPKNLTEAQAAMGIDWMSRAELSQAIPPAYSEFIGRAALTYMNARAA
jgi:DNA (cytosine-5)-methyltransferase 1